MVSTKDNFFSGSTVAYLGVFGTIESGHCIGDTQPGVAYEAFMAYNNGSPSRITL